jgi:hypothetical protein
MLRTLFIRCSKIVLFGLLITYAAFAQDNKKMLVPKHTGFQHDQDNQSAVRKKTAPLSATRVEPEYIGVAQNELPLLQNRSRRNRTVYLERIEIPKINKPE